MTIQDAIERAKKLGQERAEGRRVASDDVRSAPASQRPDIAEPDSRKHFPPLGRIEFDALTCATNNILISTDPGTAGIAAAAYRLLRSRALHRLKDERKTCIGLTSAGAGEGKTITAINLAITIAREGMRMVYLLDLDMRKPGVLVRVGCRPAHQLPDYFAGKVPVESVLYQTSIDHLVISGACEPVHGASELLASTRLDEMINYIRRRSPGALVLMDLPPVMSTDEALVVAPRADAMFLVVSEGVTRRDGLTRAIDMLSDFKVAGVILNRSTEGLGTDYYGY